MNEGMWIHLGRGSRKIVYHRDTYLRDITLDQTHKIQCKPGGPLPIFITGDIFCHVQNVYISHENLRPLLCTCLLPALGSHILQYVLI